MEKKSLRGTSLEVSSIGIGGSHIGTHTDPATSWQLLDAFVERGFHKKQSNAAAVQQ